MDLDIMASVCTNIIGNCLCVLGDAMAMPVGSMIEKFRDEFEAHIEAARARNDALVGVERRPSRSCRERSPSSAAAPAARVTFSLDGQEVRAPANMMLVDAAKYGDVEIHLLLRAEARRAGRRLPHVPRGDRGHPQAADRVLDPGQGRHGRAHPDRARARGAGGGRRVPAHQPPARLPGLRQGRRVPAAGHLLRLGRQALAVHRAQAPLRQAAGALTLIAIDRERCILCYRCVRFSQEVSEDYQLVLQERGAHSYVATFDGHPYVAPFSGNIVELCPVGALTSQPYRFRARPWDIEGSGSVCTLCPSQCNVSFTVRDERVLRVLARDHPEVDDGWLCDKGRFAYQSVHADERITSRSCATAATCAR